MKNKIILSLILNLFVLFSFAYSLSEKDSLQLKLDHLIFESEYEKDLFSDYFLHDQKNYFGLFYSIYDTKQEEKVALKYLNDYIDPIRNSVNSTNNRKKKIKHIFNKVHKTMFLYYSELIMFPEIFKSGTYNCLTGSALYSIVLDQFEIPYKIIELSNHVYIVAYPDDDEIIIESTVPDRGYLSVNDSYKKNYINFLKENKLIKPEDNLNFSIEQLFDKYYYENGKIDLEQLVGLHYYNYALALIIEEKYEASIQSIEKGLMFYNSPRLRMLYKTALELQISKQKYTEKKSVQYYGNYIELFLNEDNRSYLEDQFIRLTREQFLDFPDIELYKSSYLYLDSIIKDSVYNTGIKFIYNYERGRINVIKGNELAALPFLQKAFLIKPHNVNLEGMLTSIVIDKVLKMQNQIQACDTLDVYLDKYPLLLKNNNVKQIQAFVHIRMAYEYLVKERISSVTKEIKKFEELIGDNALELSYQDFTGTMYSEVSSYFFRKQNTSKAKYYLKRGLIYSPGNFSLVRKLQLLER